jgi:hypothetical protein
MLDTVTIHTKKCYLHKMFSTKVDARRCQIRGVQWVDFFLFPRLKGIKKGARFADVAAIQERVTAVLR